MQPYFFPYAGYFRLFAAVDEFVIFDCVQFPRRGRVHRTEVPGPSGAPEWLTLPLARQPRDVRIAELAFAPDARRRLDERLERHAWFRTARGSAAERVRSFLGGPLGSVVDFLEEGLRLVTSLAGLDVAVSRSSRLALEPALRGQDRVIAAARARGATGYVNAPGGRALYGDAAFRAAGIELAFLAPYTGRFRCLLPALMQEEPEAIRADILATTRLRGSALGEELRG
jgi:hypothetical protein